MTDCSPNVRLENVDNMCMSYFYLLLFWSNGDGIMWDYMGKDKICLVLKKVDSQKSQKDDKISESAETETASNP